MDFSEWFAKHALDGIVGGLVAGLVTALAVAVTICWEAHVRCKDRREAAAEEFRRGVRDLKVTADRYIQISDEMLIWVNVLGNEMTKTRIAKVIVSERRAYTRLQSQASVPWIVSERFSKPLFRDLTWFVEQQIDRSAEEAGVRQYADLVEGLSVRLATWLTKPERFEVIPSFEKQCEMDGTWPVGAGSTSPAGS